QADPGARRVPAARHGSPSPDWPPPSSAGTSAPASAVPRRWSPGCATTAVSRPRQGWLPGIAPSLRQRSSPSQALAWRLSRVGPISRKWTRHGSSVMLIIGTSAANPLRVLQVWYWWHATRQADSAIPEMRRAGCRGAPVLVIWGKRDRYLGKELADP